MNQEIFKNLEYQNSAINASYPFPVVLQEVYQTIIDFFESYDRSEKLCIVLPVKEYAVQWLSMPLTFYLLKREYQENKEEMAEAYKSYCSGQKLLLNNKAVVEWVKGDANSLTFKTKGNTSKARYWENTSGDLITIPAFRINNLRPAPNSRNSLSSRDAVYQNLSPHNSTPIDKLLDINSNGNFFFLKKKICVVNKYKSYEESIGDLLINGYPLKSYINVGKIDEAGKIINEGPLNVTNDVTNLCLYLIENNDIAYLLFDGFTSIFERSSDFSQINSLKVPSIVITDLSEVDLFKEIKNYGFDILNMTGYQISQLSKEESPFFYFDQKLRNFTSLNIKREICSDELLESAVLKIHSIIKDDSNQELNNLRFYLIQLANKLSRICSIIKKEQKEGLTEILRKAKSLSENNKRWLGDSTPVIEDIVLLFEDLIEKYSNTATEKCNRLQQLLDNHIYDYIICFSDGEASDLKTYIAELAVKRCICVPKILTIGDITNHITLGKRLSVIVVGWLKHNNISKIISSCLFANVTFLFYLFEGRYYSSLLRRNIRQLENVKSTFVSKSLHLMPNPAITALSDLYLPEKGFEYTPLFDVVDFELKLDNVQYLKYQCKGNLSNSVKAKLVNFDNDNFIYATDSHKFLVVDDTINRNKSLIYIKRIDSLAPGNVLAFINTERDILAFLVQQRTNKQEFNAVKHWTELWKSLLRDHYTLLGRDFKRLVAELRNFSCKKHELTIRNWLQDDNMIGPDDDDDLISIAQLTNSELLYDNIDKVRAAISKMTGWRMKAGDFIVEKIKMQLQGLVHNSFVNDKIVIEGLGSVSFLRVHSISDKWQQIDDKYVNRLLQKEFY